MPLAQVLVPELHQVQLEPGRRELPPAVLAQAAQVAAPGQAIMAPAARRELVLAEQEPPVAAREPALEHAARREDLATGPTA